MSTSTRTIAVVLLTGIALFAQFHLEGGDATTTAAVAAKDSRKGTGIVYDAAAVSRILGIHLECSDPVPQAADGEIVVYYGGWDLKQLRTCTAGKKRMWQDQVWYEKYGWKAKPGYYRLLLPVPSSNRKSWSEQLRQLTTVSAAWQPAPACVTAAALLVHLTETDLDLLKDDWCRCAEALPDDDHVGLVVLDGRVRICSIWNGCRARDLWLSAARRTLPP